MQKIFPEDTPGFQAPALRDAGASLSAFTPEHGNDRVGVICCDLPEYLQNARNSVWQEFIVRVKPKSKPVI